MLITICSWHPNKNANVIDIDTTKYQGEVVETHGLCKSCFERMMKEIKKPEPKFNCKPCQY